MAYLHNKEFILSLKITFRESLPRDSFKWYVKKTVYLIVY